MSPLRNILSILVLVTMMGLVAERSSSKDIQIEPATHPALVDADLPPLIPVETFFSTRTESWRHRVSPDGTKLLWIALHDGRPTVHFRHLNSEDVTIIKGKRAVRWAHWAADNRHITGWWDNDGDENFHFLLADSENPEKPFRDVTQYRSTKVRFQQWFPDKPLEYLLSDNRRDKSLFDLYWHNVGTGEERMVLQNPGDISFYQTDLSGNVIAVGRRLDDERWAFEVSDGDGGWNRMIEGGVEDTFWIVGTPPVNAKWAWAISNIARDRQVLVKYDLAKGRETVVYENPNADVTNVWIDDDTYELMAAWSSPDYNLIKIFNSELQSVYDKFASKRKTNFRVRSRSRNFDVLTISLSSDVTSDEAFLLDRRSGSLTKLAETAVARHSHNLSEMKPIRFTARDGMVLNGYLTIPNGTTGKKLPMVLAVHGGPFARDIWGFYDYDQFFANRGYAVLRVNYRGSTGYGRDYIAAANRQIGRAMHTDLIDGVNWAIEHGIADRDKIAIYGRSYGGYSALAGLTFTPEVFAAGVNIVGVADLELVYKTFPAYWRNWLNRWYKYIGHPDSPEDMAELRRYSPINHVEKITKPLFVAQGSNDVRVVKEHSDRIVEAAKRNGVDVEYVIYDDEGHQIRKWNNRMDLARKIERFLAKHIGGRMELTSD